LKKLLLLLSGALTLSVIAAAPAAEAATCTVVNTSRGTLTAAVVNTDVTGDLDAAPCQIDAYYDDGGAHSVSAARVHNATDYGVFNDSGNVTVDNSTVDDIGDNPVFTGVQHGLAVFFGTKGTTTGTISDSQVFNYQKNGITVIGSNSSANITDTSVTGLGKVEFIAQNGIQFSDGATPLDVSGNTVTDNHYSGPSKPTIATGILLAQANVTGRDVGRISSSNDVNHNQCNICYVK
jgi:hypothetical protein